jgi:parvulin-like peptidyl-prolyl isomerase/predicted MFS family arabinose efflux permease
VAFTRTSASWTPPALRVRPFRWYWAAQWPTLLGTWMQVVALGYLVYSRTGSTTAVAVVAAADGLPAVVLSLAGGVLADRIGRRRILLVTQSVLGVTAATLALLVATDHAPFFAIVVVAIIFGSADAVDLPARQALVADLVERDLVVNAVALGATAMSATRIVGPSVAGLLIGVAGPAVCFGFLAAAYLAPISVLLTVIPASAAPLGASRSAIGDLRAGLREVRRDPLVRGVVVACAGLAFLGVSYMPFLPVLAKTQLHSGPQVLGLLYSIGGIGGLVGGAALATLGRGAGRLQLLTVGGLVYAASLFAVAHSTLLGVTLPGLIGISFAFMAVNTSLTTLLQTDTDPSLRGRLLGIYATLFAGLAPLGTVLYGLLSRVVGLFDAIGVGALLVGVITVAVALTPAFRARVAGAALVIALLLTSCTMPARNTVAPSGPVASVSGAPISRALFDVRLNSALTQLRQAGAPAGNAAMETRVRASVLRSLILDAIIAMEARSQGLGATDAEVGNEIQQEANQHGGMSGLQTALASAGDSLAQLRDEVRSQLNEQHLEDRFAQQRAAQVEQNLASGADFAATARQYSDDTGTSSAGGDLGSIALDSLPTYDANFAAAVRSLHTGAYTQTPARDAGGYDILQVYAATPSSRSVRHILVAAPVPYVVRSRPAWFAEALFATVAQLCQEGAIHVYIQDAGSDPCTGAPTLPASATPTATH